MNQRPSLVFFSWDQLQHRGVSVPGSESDNYDSTTKTTWNPQRHTCSFQIQRFCSDLFRFVKLLFHFFYFYIFKSKSKRVSRMPAPPLVP